MDGVAYRRELSKREDSLVELLNRAHHAIGESFEHQLKLHGISATEWRVLAALDERDGVPMTELAEQVLFKQPTLTKAVDRMQRAQLVQRRTPNEDRRRTLVHLTERGRRIAHPLAMRARQHEQMLTRALGDSESRELRAALLRFIARVHELPREHRAPRGGRAAAD
jgi:DNA-binding MarR family transcriptional regulator